jgi:HEAT repeat protein
VQTVNGLPVPRDLGVPALRALVAQGGPAVWAAIQALAERGDDASLAALAEYAGSRDEMLRRASVEAIGRHTRGRAAGSVVLRALRDASPFVVRTACHAAAATGLDEARDAVLIHLGATEASTRAAAAQSLALLAAPSDFDRVLHTSVGDSDPSVRKDAAWTLRTRCAGPDTWRRLFDVWRCDPLPRHRVWACELAAEFGGAEADELLRPFAADPDGHVRKAAASRQSGTTG